MSYITFYHYTDAGSLGMIKASGVIRKSTSGAGGQGVYLTTLPPSTMKSILALNNYDGLAMMESDWVEKMHRDGKVDCYIELKLWSSHVQKLETGPRDVWLYPYSDIDLGMLDKPVYVGMVGGQASVYQKRSQPQPAPMQWGASGALWRAN